LFARCLTGNIKCVSLFGRTTHLMSPVKQRLNKLTYLIFQSNNDQANLHTSYCTNV
jgi:hypothetical protein